jgi:hypothetical protein
MDRAVTTPALTAAEQKLSIFIRLINGVFVFT